MQRRSVDLPEPDAPISATASCSATSRSTPFSTSSSPKALVTPRISMTGLCAHPLALSGESHQSRKRAIGIVMHR